MPDPLVTLFMLVIDRDCMFADYAIASYMKIYRQRRRFGHDDFRLHVYLNCLSEENKNRYIAKWQAYPYVTVFDNAEKIAAMESPPYPGQPIVSPEGGQRFRDDRAESYDELWTTELSAFTTPYVATVDADFEVLHHDFYFYLFEALEAAPTCIGASSCYSPTAATVDVFTRRQLLLHERNHTWFCIYKREAFEICKVSHFYVETDTVGGLAHAYDSAAYFQAGLRERGLHFISAPDRYRTCFVHYGASSKNRSLTPANVGFYRTAFLLRNQGIHHGASDARSIRVINRLCRGAARICVGGYLSRMARERSRYVFDVPGTLPARR